MPDEPKGQKEVVEEKPQEDMTASDKPAVDKEDDLSIPDDSSDRTKEQFAKLTKRNKEMSEQLRQRDEKENIPDGTVLDSLKPPKPTQPAPAKSMPVPQAQNFPGLTQQQVDQQYNNLVDENGYVDVNLLKGTLTKLSQEADKARAESKMLREDYRKYEETRQVREAHDKYPWMNPDSKQFDPKFYKAVRNEMIGQYTKGEMDLVKAGDDAMELYDPSKNEKPKEDESAKKLAKEQANATGTSTVRVSQREDDDTNELVTATRHGVKGAVAERLRRSGY